MGKMCLSFCPIYGSYVVGHHIETVGQYAHRIEKVGQNILTPQLSRSRGIPV